MGYGVFDGILIALGVLIPLTVVSGVVWWCWGMAKDRRERKREEAVEEARKRAENPTAGGFQQGTGRPWDTRPTYPPAVYPQPTYSSYHAS
ncbi:hypothetical protein F4778DRAFT_733290 [Xylariomycetidae sp. FL2044]|nr:hypothetical protein F4778DRAFT_733290 [Xylariomycetidae sp. FL2044]